MAAGDGPGDLTVSDTSSRAWSVAGKPKRATPLRAVVASSVRTPPAVVAYEPGWAVSAVWSKAAVAELGSAGSGPVSGRNGKSPAMLQPGPERWVRLKPEMAVSVML